MHGDFLGYRLSLRPRDVEESKATVVPIEDPSLTVRGGQVGREGRETKVRPQSPCLFMHTSVTPSSFCIDGQDDLQCTAGHRQSRKEPRRRAPFETTSTCMLTRLRIRFRRKWSSCNIQGRNYPPGFSRPDPILTYARPLGPRPPVATVCANMCSRTSSPFLYSSSKSRDCCALHRHVLHRSLISFLHMTD